MYFVLYGSSSPSIAKYFIDIMKVLNRKFLVKPDCLYFVLKFSKICWKLSICILHFPNLYSNKHFQKYYINTEITEIIHVPSTRPSIWTNYRLACWSVLAKNPFNIYSSMMESDVYFNLIAFWNLFWGFWLVIDNLFSHKPLRNIIESEFALNLVF